MVAATALGIVVLGSAATLYWYLHHLPPKSHSSAAARKPGSTAAAPAPAPAPTTQKTRTPKPGSDQAPRQQAGDTPPTTPATVTNPNPATPASEPAGAATVPSTPPQIAQAPATASEPAPLPAPATPAGATPPSAPVPAATATTEPPPAAAAPQPSSASPSTDPAVPPVAPTVAAPATQAAAATPPASGAGAVGEEPAKPAPASEPAAPAPAQSAASEAPPATPAATPAEPSRTATPPAATEQPHLSPGFRVPVTTAPAPTARPSGPPAQPERVTITSPQAPVGEAMAALWNRANDGDPEAMVELARRYFRGIDLPLDRAEGARWLLRAAEAGHRLAQFNAGVLYERGLSVPERNFQIKANAATAALWYGKAAEAGVPLAQHNLAMLYRYGSGVQRDSGRAYNLLRDAARQGLSASMLILGDMQKVGEGTVRDSLMALVWYRLGQLVEQRQSQGQPTALMATFAERIASVQDVLTPDERARAEQTAATEMQALMGTPRPAGAPAEVPVDRVAQITEIQRLLTKLGHYKGEIDGKLGPSTRTAIRAFERKTGLAVSGEPSPALADALRNGLTARAVPAPTPPPAVTFSAAEPADKLAGTAWPADRRSQITTTQKLLAQVHLFTGEVDGKMGPATRTAIRAFEKQSGMTQTGEPTPELFAALQRAADGGGQPGTPAAAPAAPATPAAQPASAAAAAATPPPATAAATPAPATVMPPAASAAPADAEPAKPQPATAMPDGWPSERRAQIRIVQKLLIEAQLYNGELDGKMGPGTRTAIRTIEKQAGMPETGEPSPEMYAALQHYVESRKSAPAPASGPAAKPSAAAVDGWPADRAQQIGKTQLLLQQLGYYDGGIDGQLGKGTRAAITSFQKEAGLGETGEPSAELWDSLQRKQAERKQRR